MKSIRSIAEYSLLSLLLITAPQVYGRVADFDKPVDVKADRSEYSEQSNSQVLEGNVVITQGSMRIEADRITVTLADNKLSTIKGEGNPIKFQQENEQGQLIQGECREILYEAALSRLTLTGNATLKEPRQQLSSDRIVFNARTQTVIAERGETGRVSITIQPPDNNEE